MIATGLRAWLSLRPAPSEVALLDLVMQQPTMRGLGAIRNHRTIAHISVLLVATAAHHLGHPDKLAFVRSFVPNFLIDR